MRELLLRLGVDPNRIILETTGTDMRTSALGVRRILEERNLGTRVALVTSALDVRRATLTFANVALQVIPRATDFITYQPGAAQQRTLRLADFIANAEALALSTRVLNEYYTFIFYFLRGWLSPTIF
uniref:YdcF family protein n=1 Tax=Desertifilum tharense IPPAS B-1220 TaxID=1781255 RepID=A0ACD5GX84_9CYAN